MVDDLRAESDALDALVADLPADGWRTRDACARAGPSPTRSPTSGGPTASSLVAVTDEPAFATLVAEAAPRATTFVDEGAEELAVTPPAEMLAEWRTTRARAARRAARASPTAASCRGSARR